MPQLSRESEAELRWKWVGPGRISGSRNLLHREGAVAVLADESAQLFSLVLLLGFGSPLGSLDLEPVKVGIHDEASRSAVCVLFCCAEQRERKPGDLLFEMVVDLLRAICRKVEGFRG